MSALQKRIVTGASIVVAGLSVFAASMSIAAGLHKSTAPTPVEGRMHFALRHVSPHIVTLMHWTVDKGPDPFATPHHDKARPQSTTPLRKQLRLDAPIYWHNRSLLPKKRTLDPGSDAYPSRIRMAGFYSGNGVYAVLQTPDQTVVVNPGDRLVDGGKVTEIGPHGTTLQRGNRTYNVDMGESL